MASKISPLNGKDLINRMRALSNAEELIRNVKLRAAISLIKIINNTGNEDIAYNDLREKVVMDRTSFYDALKCICVGDMILVKHRDKISKGLFKTKDDLYSLTAEGKEAAEYIQENLTKLSGYEDVFGRSL